MRPVAALQHVSKRYYRRTSRRMIFSEWRDRPSADAFWALEDVDFEVAHGERVGIIGRNGAGKTTLLRVLSGLVRPTCGARVISGSSLAISEVQAGLHRELTGLENIHFLALLAGIARRDLPARLDGIVAFSGLDSASLHTPVKNYSSGMAMRLALSVALAAEADVLLMDEGLMSGDAAFRTRVRTRLEERTAGGQAGVFVSHDLDELQQQCDRLVYLRAGKVAAAGIPADVLAVYERDLVQRAGAREAS